MRRGAGAVSARRVDCVSYAQCHRDLGSDGWRCDAISRNAAPIGAAVHSVSVCDAKLPQYAAEWRLHLRRLVD